MLLLKQSHWDEAEVAAKKAVQHAGPQSEFEAHKLLARIYLGKQNWSQAEKELKWFTGNYPHPEYHEGLGNILMEQGKLAEAHGEFQKAEQIRQNPAMGSAYQEDLNERRIRSGSPLNIFLNRTHLRYNGEALCSSRQWIKALGCWDTGEIAGVVSVSVDDGEALQVKHTLILFETGITSGVDLPLIDVLTYSTNAYEGESIYVEVTIFEFDSMNSILKDLLGTAAAIGKSLTPSFAPRSSSPHQIGKILLSANENDIIDKFAFRIIGWKGSQMGTLTGRLGSPLYVPHWKLCRGIVVYVDDTPLKGFDGGRTLGGEAEHVQHSKLTDMSDPAGLEVLQNRVWHHLRDKNTLAQENDMIDTICPYDETSESAFVRGNSRTSRWP